METFSEVANHSWHLSHSGHRGSDSSWSVAPTSPPVHCSAHRGSESSKDLGGSRSHDSEGKRPTIELPTTLRGSKCKLKDQLRHPPGLPTCHCAVLYVLPACACILCIDIPCVHRQCVHVCMQILHSCTCIVVCASSSLLCIYTSVLCFVHIHFLCAHYACMCTMYMH